MQKLFDLPKNTSLTDAILQLFLTEVISAA